jgi:hypothetical protein
MIDPLRFIRCRAWAGVLAGALALAGAATAATAAHAAHAAHAARADEFTVYIAPNGSDKADGSSPASAVRTLGRAQSLLAQARPSNGQKVLAVRFLPGVYRRAEVVWNFHAPGRRVLLAPAEEANGKFDVIIDGEGSSETRFFLLRLDGASNEPSPVATSLTIRGLHVRNYCEGISLGDWRGDTVITDNTIEGNLFTDIGSKHQTPTENVRGQLLPKGECAAALRLQRTARSVVRGNTFRRIENLPAEQTASGEYGPSLLHSIYIADHSTGNLIENNRFEQFTGSPVRIRAESDDNRILSNTFAQPVYAVPRNAHNQIYAISQWYCNEASAACRDKAQRGKTECPSVGTEIVGNRTIGDLGLYADQSQSKRATCVREGLPPGHGIEPRIQDNSASP